MLTDQKTLLISIIIPVLNEAKRLGSTLSAVSGHGDLEVIVVDGGSTDSSVAIAKEAGATVLEAAAGRGRQMNAGAAAARGDIFLFLHGDSLLPEGFQHEVRQALSKPGVVAGAFRFAIDAKAMKFRLVELFTNWRARFLQLPYGDQAIFLDARRFRALGGFQQIPLLEDLELISRLKQQGRVAILDQAVLTSARRWQRLGVVRTTCINQMILVGYLLGVSPVRLAGRWYGQGKKR